MKSQLWRVLSPEHLSVAVFDYEHMISRDLVRDRKPYLIIDLYLFDKFQP